MAKRDLESLPPSANEFWELAEVEIHELKKPKDCDHFFIHKSSREVECRKCFAGYYLGPTDSVRGGHIYHGSQFVF
jgi:hypothetical protein